MLLRWSLGNEGAGDAIEKAVSQALTEGFRTSDIASSGFSFVGTAQFGDEVAKRIEV
jgi:3-isopropylmalate dehydrogenase